MPRIATLTTAALALCSLAAPANAQFLSRLIAKPAPLADTQDALESLVSSVTPSVVAIEAHRPPTTGAGDTRSAGAGFIISKDGKILTSEHVIADAISIYVTLHYGDRIRARRLGADPRSDLAVIQIDTPYLTPVKWLDNPDALRRGHMVVAFGNPLGLSADGHAAPSMGLVSAIARPLPDTFGQSEDRYYGDMIQCTTPVGPGYSGGPLVDIHGRVVGVLTAIASQNRPGESLAFAVPITQRTRAVIAKLSRGEDVDYGYLGISVRDDSATANRPFNFTTVSSLNEPLVPSRAPVLTLITPGGPADRAGLQTGDAVLSVNATPIATADELVQLIGAAGPGRRVALTIRRDNRTLQTTADLTRRPSPTVQNASRQWLFRGAALGEVDAAMLGQLDAPAGALLVLMVAAGSPADRAGLSPGDVVVRVNGRGLTPDSADALAALTDDCLLGLANGGSILLKPPALRP